MKQPNYKGRELLPYSVIEAARAGEADAVDRVLQYYDGYINKLCTRTLYDEYGQPHVRVDEFIPSSSLPDDTAPGQRKHLTLSMFF